MEKNVIILPGTRWQIPLVKKIKKRGYRAVVFDYYDNQPAYEYADEYQLVDIHNKEKVLELAKKYFPVAVISDECDIATPTIAWVSKRLGKPSIGMNMAELYTNKYAMREFCKENGLKSPIYYKCSEVQAAVEIFRGFGKKMIMKPLDSNSSRGIYSVESEKDIFTHFEESLSYSKSEKSILLEEYIEGEEFSIDGLKTDDKFFPLSISKKYHFSYNENLDQALIFSYFNDEYDYDALRRVNEDFIVRSGLEFGLTHAEYKFFNGSYYLIEIGARGGGNLISSVINPNLYGIDTQEILIDWATGSKIKTGDIRYTDGYKERCSWLEFFDTQGKEGKLKEIRGLDVLKSNKCIKSFHFFHSIGDTIGKAKDGGTRLGYYIACCDSSQELNRIKDVVDKNVQIILE